MLSHAKAILASGRFALGLALSAMLLSANAATAQSSSPASPKATPTPISSPQSSPAPALSPQERQELEQFRESERMKYVVEETWKNGTIRDIVKYEVDSGYGRTLTLLQLLIVVLILATLVAPLSFWLLRNIVIAQLVEQAKKSFNQEIATDKDEATLQLQNLVSTAQIVLKELAKERNLAQQEIATLKQELEQLKRGVAIGGVNPVFDRDRLETQTESHDFSGPTSIPQSPLDPANEE